MTVLLHLLSNEGLTPKSCFWKCCKKRGEEGIQVVYLEREVSKGLKVSQSAVLDLV